MDKNEPSRLLWIAAEGQSADLAVRTASSGGFSLVRAAGIPEAVEHINFSLVDAAVLSLPLPGYGSFEAVEELRRADGSIPLIVYDPGARAQDAARLTRAGVCDVWGGDTIPEQLAGAIADALVCRSAARRPASPEPWRQLLVGSSQPFEEAVQIIRLVGSRRSTVLITGETGTGKEMAARALHLAGPRGRMPMVSVCCSALPENLLEAELFGHVKGAFTGAFHQRTGRFEQANGGSIFLDEIGEMPLDLQAKLLRVLQEREFQRLGSSETIRVDVRVIAATNADLAERVRQQRFREDLYYRLNVVPLHMPSLRARATDIPALAHHFVEKVCRAEDLPLKHISREALSRLRAYSWPGNVRQLENTVERAVVLSGDRDTLYPADFPLPGVSAPHASERCAGPLIHVPDDGLDFEQTVAQIARGILEQALRKTKGNKKMAADLLRLKRTTLAAKLRSLEGGDPELAELAADFVHSA